MKKSFERWIRNLRTPRSRPEDRSDLRDELVALASDLAVETDFEPLMTRMCGRMRRLVGCENFSQPGDVFLRGAIHQKGVGQGQDFFKFVVFRIHECRYSRFRPNLWSIQSANVRRTR